MAEQQLSALGDAMKLSEQVLSQLPNEVKASIPTAQYEINKAKEMLNNNDSSGLTDMMKRFSNASEILMRKDADSTTR